MQYNEQKRLRMIMLDMKMLAWPIMTNGDEDELLMDMKMVTGADAAGGRCICRGRGSGNCGGKCKRQRHIKM